MCVCVCKHNNLHKNFKINLILRVLNLYVNFLSFFQRKEFVKYAKVFPFSEMLDFKIPSKWYRRTVGSLEIICGIAMAFFPNRKYNFILSMVLFVFIILF